MSVKLRKKRNKDGTTSLYLDIYLNGIRKYEFLKELKLDAGTSPLTRTANKARLDQAKKLALHRSLDIESKRYNITTDVSDKTLVIKWMQSYIENYTKSDKRNMQGALNHFIDFLPNKEHPDFTFSKLDEDLISDYRDHLNNICRGEGGASYFARFKKMVKRAYKVGLTPRNLAENVKLIKGESVKKDVLTLDELTLIAKTPCESPQVKYGFLFSAMTGLRWCDLVSLTWNDIRLTSHELKMLQGKTKKPIWQRLNQTALTILSKQDQTREFVFDLPSANGANKTIKALIKRAGLDKKISWHNARHSFGTNLILNDEDVFTVSKMLGHTTLKHTQRYIDIASEMKRKASEKLNIEI